MRYHNYHVCGGTILLGAPGTQNAHRYCDRCGAYTYDIDDRLPGGTDATANQAAWDAGDDSSPEARPERRTIRSRRSRPART